jgi:hypothetical protein
LDFGQLVELSRLDSVLWALVLELALDVEHYLATIPPGRLQAADGMPPCRRGMPSQRWSPAWIPATSHCCRLPCTRGNAGKPSDSGPSPDAASLYRPAAGLPVLPGEGGVAGTGTRRAGCRGSGAAAAAGDTTPSRAQSSSTARRI